MESVMSINVIASRYESLNFWHFYSGLDKSLHGAKRDFWVKARFGILVKIYFRWANQGRG